MFLNNAVLFSNKKKYYTLSNHYIGRHESKPRDVVSSTLIKTMRGATLLLSVSID